MAVHPLIIHFPIALLALGHLALIYTLLRPLENTLTAARLALEGFINGTLGLGFAGLVLSVITGLFDMQASPKALARDGWLQLAIFHIVAALLLLPVNGILLYRRFVISPPLSEKYQAPAVQLTASSSDKVASLTKSVYNKTFDRLSLFLAGLALLLLATAGYLGGVLVYDYRVGIK